MMWRADPSDEKKLRPRPETHYQRASYWDHWVCLLVRCGSLLFYRFATCKQCLGCCFNLWWHYVAFGLLSDSAYLHQRSEAWQERGNRLGECDHSSWIRHVG